jgi:hypothetical protein
MDTKIQTKYRVGDKVWIIDARKAVERIVYGVMFLNEKIVYYFSKESEVFKYGWINESDVYSSKDELLKEL